MSGLRGCFCNQSRMYGFSIPFIPPGIFCSITLSLKSQASFSGRIAYTFFVFI